jgi:hypothetical protein
MLRGYMYHEVDQYPGFWIWWCRHGSPDESRLLARSEAGKTQAVPGKISSPDRPDCPIIHPPPVTVQQQYPGVRADTAHSHRIVDDLRRRCAHFSALDVTRTYLLVARGQGKSKRAARYPTHGSSAADVCRRADEDGRVVGRCARGWSGRARQPADTRHGIPPQILLVGSADIHASAAAVPSSPRVLQMHSPCTGGRCMMIE